MAGSSDSALKRLFDSFLNASERDSQVANAAEHGVNFRFRPPFRRTCKHDARQDGIYLVIQNMTARGIPLWAANIVSRRFVEECSEQDSLARIPFDENVYEPIAGADWCHRVTTAFEEFAKKYSLGEYELPTKPAEWDQFLYSLYTFKNRKPKMEDRHVVLPSLAVIASTESESEKIQKSDALFAVFDGHNGIDCAAYAATHIPDCLLESMAKGEDKNSMLRNVFHTLDRRMTLRCKKEALKSGTTACCAYVSDGTAYLAWCGDSSIGVFRKDEVVTLSKRHVPTLPEEVERIEGAGGVVMMINGEPRVNGVLNISRSLGDVEARPVVSQEPDLLTYPLNKDNDYMMFLSSDGIWDTFNESEIWELTREFITSHPSSDYAKLGEHLGGAALRDGASDNLTMIVVYLDTPENVWKKVNESPATPE